MSIPVKAILPLFHSAMTWVSGENGFDSGKGVLAAIFINEINVLR